jgi:hypothetical protein
LSSLLRRDRAQRNRALGAAVAAVVALPSAASAFEFETGNEDLSIRFDNTVRANVSVRAESQDKAMLANPNFDTYSTGRASTTRPIGIPSPART